MEARGEFERLSGQWPFGFGGLWRGDGAGLWLLDQRQ